MEVHYDRGADAAYVLYAQGQVARTEPVDDTRFVDWTDAGAVIGLEFLDVQDGVVTIGLPVDTVALQQVLAHAGIAVRDRIVVGGGCTLPDYWTEGATVTTAPEASLPHTQARPSEEP